MYTSVAVFRHSATTRFAAVVMMHALLRTAPYNMYLDWMKYLCGVVVTVSHVHVIVQS